MRDIVGHLAHPGHQPLDLVEHVVEVGGELVELVASALERHAVGEVAAHHPLGGAVDLLDPAQQVAAHYRAADQPGDQRDEARPQQRLLDALAEQRSVADVARHQQAVAVGNDDQRALRGLHLGRARDLHLDIEGDRTGRDRRSLRPAGDVAGKRMPLGVGDEIEHPVAAIAGAARGDDLDEPGKARAAHIARRAQ